MVDSDALPDDEVTDQEDDGIFFSLKGGIGEVHDIGHGIFRAILQGLSGEDSPSDTSLLTELLSKWRGWHIKRLRIVSMAFCAPQNDGDEPTLIIVTEEKVDQQ
ncbi:MAG: hypothetical protein JWM56_1203 [Candidatus Peribacteria bacterium]|nr:hypothetical protein [Candidatus Peribacteria bacterium]